jgi:phospholipid/cholesterol/gamma-HCH transport system permease protein
MSDQAVTGTLPSPAPSVKGRVRRLLAGIGGRPGRAQSAVSASLAWAAIRLTGTWRRTVRFEFRRALRQAIAGALSTVLVTAALIGFLMVYQALYWLGAAGQEGLIGSILVTILVREVAPVLIGLILLGRSGTVVLSEIGRLGIGGQVHALEAQGLDTFHLLILPRACAFAIASFSLGMLFLLATLVAGSLPAACWMPSICRSGRFSTGSFLRSMSAIS